MHLIVLQRNHCFCFGDSRFSIQDIAETKTCNQNNFAAIV